MAIWRDLFPFFFFLSSQGFFPLLEAYSYTSSMTELFRSSVFAFQSLLGSGRGKEGKLHVRKAFSFRRTSGFFDEDQWMQMGLVFHLSGQRRFSVIPLTYIFV
jgi:hypothetical protein